MNARELTDSLRGVWRGEYGSARCPSHDDRNPSLSIRDGDGGKVLVFCNAGCQQDAVVAALMDRGLWNSDHSGEQAPTGRKAKPAWTPVLPVPEDAPRKLPPHRLGKPSATWTYCDSDGRPLFAVCRFDHDGSKDILPLTYCRNPGGRCEWRWQGMPAPRPLYGLPGLAQRPDAPVLVVEGEKAADAARELFADMVAMTWPGGTGGVSQADWTPLKGRSVVIWPDADEAGTKAARAAAKACMGAGAADVRIVELAVALPEKWDVADALPEGWTTETLAQLVEAAQPIADVGNNPGVDLLADLAQCAANDPGAPFEPAVLKTLKRLRNTDPAAWQRLRSDLKDAKVRMSDLDRALDRLDGDAGNERDEKTGRPLKPKEVETWHEEIGGIALLDELSQRLREYIIMAQAAADAVALWAVHTHAIDACHYTPRLFITSPDKRCGKTQLLKVIGKAVARPLLAGNISPASVFRTIQAAHPTLLIDEFDSHKKDDEELRGVVNNGYERGNPNIRCDPNTLEPLEFDTFAACAIASIGRTWPTVEDRSIIIRLHRKRPSEKVRRLRRGSAPDLTRLASMAARWAGDHINAIEAADPKTPEALSDRAADIWTPLLAIADLAGGDWPVRARHAALTLSADGVVEDESLGTMLLADLRDFLDAHPGDGCSTKNIIDYLVTLEERPWPAFGKARKPINAKQLADILKPFEVRSGTIRIGTDTSKGYRRKDIEYAAGRYLANSPVTTSQPVENLRKLPNSPVTYQPGVTAEKTPKPVESVRCDVATAKTAKSSGEDISRPDPDDFEERAAIMQYDGELPREEAEKLARREL